MVLRSPPFKYNPSCGEEFLQGCGGCSSRQKEKKNLHLMKQEILPSAFRQNSLDIVSNIKPCKTHITDSKHCC